jgi:hypothetical protein
MKSLFEWIASYWYLLRHKSTKQQPVTEPETQPHETTIDVPIITTEENKTEETPVETN